MNFLKIMTMMCLSLLWVSVSYAQVFYEASPGEAPDHLTPVSLGYQGYKGELRELLCYSNRKVISYVLITPSFSAESCIALYFEVDNEILKKFGGISGVPNTKKKYFLSYSEPHSRIWIDWLDRKGEGVGANIRIENQGIHVPIEFAATLQRIMAKLLLEVRYPKYVSYSKDGTKYELSAFVKGLGYISGEASSPPPKGVSRLISTIENVTRKLISYEEAQYMLSKIEHGIVVSE